MTAAENLALIAEISVAMAGFSSVVVAYGRRYEAGWSASDRIRLSILVGGSLAVLFLALLPGALRWLGVDDVLAWTLSSGVVAVYVLVHGAVVALRMRGQVGRSPGKLHPAIAAATIVAALAALVLQLLNLAGRMGDPAGAYIVGLELLLGAATLQFLRLVFTNLDP